MSGLLGLQRSNPSRYPHLLQGTDNSGFDILFACPGDSLVLASPGRLYRPGDESTSPGKFLVALNDWWRSLATPARESELPFTGGWFVYLGYELAGEIEPTLVLPDGDTYLPIAFATRFATAVLYDRHNGACYIVGEPEQQATVDLIASDLDGVQSAGAAKGMLSAEITALGEAPDDDYLAAVGRIRDYIHEGDVFQANLSRQWHIELRDTPRPADVYASLRAHNPAPFSGLLSWQETAVISSSPERLVRVRGRCVETRPIAGTRPRGSDRNNDTALSDELLAHPKERAEHIMLIDLERNDLGRICVPGSIEVNDFMVLESYRHVHHIVSNVRGELCDDVEPGDVLRAVFPGGTITGCPKVRCMEIIAELEQCPRGAYTGSMGYLGRDGSMDMNILIRTMVMHGRAVSLRAGAGIVADSVPAAELAETRDKARGMLRALGLESA